MRARWQAGVAVGALASMLAGCVSAPAPDSASSPWVAPEGAMRHAGSWQALRDERPDFSKPLTLAELSDLALRNNPASRQAWNEARAAVAQVEKVRGNFMPTVTAVGSGSRQWKDSDRTMLNQDFVRYGPSLELDYLVMSFGGGRSAAVEQALQTVYAADFAFNRTIQTVLRSVAEAYHGLVSARAGIGAAEANLKDAQTALDTAKARMVQEVGTQLDVLQAQAALDRAQSALAGAQGLEATARSGLARALGVPADSPVEVAAPAEGLPDVPESAQVSRMIDEALGRRPDIAALRARLAAGEAAIRVAGAARWPMLYLQGQVAQSEAQVWAGEEMMSEREWGYGAGLSLRWTLFDGLQTISDKHAAEAQAAAARDQLRQAEVAASAEVWDGVHACVTARKKHEASEAFLRSATAAHELAKDSYAAGLSTMLDLLGAENVLAQARSEQIAARQAVFTALAELAWATGAMEQGSGPEPAKPGAPDATKHP